MAIQFTKMSGSGNDFVIIDNRKPIIEDSNKVDFVKRICNRKMSVGADGVIFVEKSDKADIKWDFYNDDGSSIENGAYTFPALAAGAECTTRSYALFLSNLINAYHNINGSGGINHNTAVLMFHSERCQGSVERDT